jgi:hypothetical protein
MSLKQTVLTAALATPLMLIGPWASAEEKRDHDHDQEHRQHGSHMHGIAALNLVLEGQELHIELDSPAANIVGFEHAPSSKDDHAALDKAVATLKDGDRLFKFNDDAGCRMEMAKVTSELLDEEHDEHEGHAEEKAEAHAHEDKEGHDHEEHEGEHAKKDENEHEGGGETHSDIDATYHFECATPDKLTQLTVELFEAFSGMEELKVQYIIESKQGAAELSASDHVVKF